MRYIFVFSNVLIIFAIKGVLQLDPDFGWHIRTGLYLLTHGVPLSDPFSYSLPSYPFIAYTWLPDLLLALTYPLVGALGLSVFFAILALSSFRLQLSSIKKSYSLIFFLLSALSLLLFAGVRIQVLSWFFFSLVLKITWNNKLWNKWKYGLPVIFLLWANMHASFPVGLLALVVLRGTSLVKEPKTRLVNFLIISLCIGATLINPYGVRLWQELWLISSSNLLHLTIPEWMPAVFLPHIVLWLYICLSTALILKYRSHFPRSHLIMYALLFLAGLWSMRHLPFWLILSLPLTIKGIEQLHKEIKTKEKQKIMFIKRFVLPIILLIVMGQTIVMLKEASFFSEKNYYPQKAVAFLKAQNPQKVFTYYRWGGYLIWHLPETKAYMDGRMVHWQKPNCSKNENCYLLNEYRSALNQITSLTDLLEKYDVTIVLLSTKPEKNNHIVLRFADEWEKAKALKENRELYPPLVSQLQAAGFKQIYRDTVSVIYEKTDE